MDACEPTQSRAPQETKQHGLGLVIFGMTYRNHPTVARFRVCVECGVARIACVTLLGRTGLHIHPKRRAGDAKRLCTSHRSDALERGFGTQLMIHRRCLEFDVETLAQRMDRVEQGGGVRATGEGDEHAIAFGHQGTTTHCLKDRSDEHVCSLFAAPLRYHRGVTSTRDQIAHGTRLLLAALASASLGLGGEFSGCGGPGTPPSGPVPEGPPVQCLVDTDCTTPMCQQARCIANRCVVGDATFVDSDGDGFGPPPCGVDCNDFNSRTVPGAFEGCDLEDNDCDGRIDEGATAQFVGGRLTVEALASAPMLIGSAPGLLFLSNGARSLEARWIGTESTQVGIASIVDGPVGLAAARSLGEGRAEILWTTRTAPVALHRATLRVTLGTNVSITIERTETVMTLSNLPTALQMESDARGAAILVGTDPTLLLLPELAPVPMATPHIFDLALAGDVVAVPNRVSGAIDLYDRGTGTVRGTFTPEGLLSPKDAVVGWGPRLFVAHSEGLTEVDTTTMGALSTVIAGNPWERVFGVVGEELMYVDNTLRLVGLSETLAYREHASLSYFNERNQIFELGTRVVVVSTGTDNTTYQVEQCGN